MKKTKLFFILIILFTVIAFSSCTALDEEVEMIETAETYAAEKTMRRGGIND
ncbi:hypothetical protein [Polaribacter porphyrae]|uniref:hypothetical protein n=1 Tax=Polaribacter porphyrae TaxID=1137780 RepID=UPI0014763E90|nr:hypothetical protein [Polaribacter porphyrae]